MVNHLPERFEVLIGNFSGPSYKIRKLYDDTMECHVLGYGFRRENVRFISPEKQQWETFWKEIGQIGIWGLQHDHEEMEHNDSAFWRITIKQDNKKFESSGDIILPGVDDTVIDKHTEYRLEKSTRDFNSFLAAIMNLLGGQNFH